MSGLEVLGAVASSIALAQAVKGTITAVNLLREIRQIRQQCDDLKREIVIIDSFILEARRQTGLPSSSQPPSGTTQQHPLVSLAVQELQEISEALNQIVSEYSNDRKWHDPKRIAKKIQWLFESKKIEELGRRAQNTKITLHFATNIRAFSSIDRLIAQNEVILETIRQRTVYYVENGQHTSRGLPTGPLPVPIQTPAFGHVERQVEELESADTPCSEQHVSTSETSIKSTATSLQPFEFHSLSLTDRGGGCAISTQEESYMSVTTIQPLGTRRCGQDCRCRCHQDPQEYSGYPWVSAVLGSWRLRNQAVDRICELQCGLNMGPEFEYRFPEWLWPRSVPFGGHRRGPPVFTFSPCAPLTFSLRAPRTIDLKVDDLTWIETPSLLQRRVRDGWVYFPDDVDDFGLSLMERALEFEVFESVEMLLELWKNVLPQQGLSKGVGYQINLILRHRSSVVRNEKTRNVLATTLSFVQGAWITRRIHLAAKKGDTVEMRQALREHPEAINELDGCGYAPIHHAIPFKNLDVLEQLVHAGADINIRNNETRTPLMIAADLHRDEAMRILLQNQQCRRHVDLSDRFGRTALHQAIDEGVVSVECLRMLLEAGASIEKRDFASQTPLQLLASNHVGRQTAHQILRLFQEKHARLDVRDINGSTPALDAVMMNNVPVLHTLVEAGASLSTADNFSQNILHYAAHSANLEMMTYLAAQPLTGVDPRLRNANGSTPLRELAWCFLTPDWHLPSNGRRPSPEEQKFFISLYFDLLSRDLLRYLSTLMQLLRAAGQRDARTSTERIATLIEKSDASQRQDMVKWYRGIQGNVRGENWHQVILDVRDEYDEAYKEWSRAGVARNKSLRDPEVKAFF